MFSINFPPSKFFKNLNRLLTIGFLVAVGVTGGIIPSIDKISNQLTFKGTAYAQDFTAGDVTNYAKAVLAIETHRQQAYQDIQRIIGTQPSDIVCNNPNSFASLPADAKQVARTFCRTSKKIVENSGLTVSQFNTITSSVQSNKSLERRIQDAMLRIQQQQ
jgi:hypothetical protein